MAKSIFWFRQDLRVEDNPGLCAAAEAGEVLPVFIWERDPKNQWPLGGASKWWLHKSLQALIDSGVPVVIYEGKPLEVLQGLVKETGAEGVFWNRCYEPHSIARDKEIKETLGCATSCNGSLLFEPWTVKNKSGGFYKVFTPYWKHCVASESPRRVVEKPAVSYGENPVQGVALEALGLLPKNPDWSVGFDDYWQPGEVGAMNRLKWFLDGPVYDYGKDRDLPGKEGTSRLSPHLHWGEISPHQVWEEVHGRCDIEKKGVQVFLSEIGWREFSYHLLYHFPDLPKKAFQEKFTKLPWAEDREVLRRWEKGQTGYPIVDAGMRQLWQMGWMHNRVRMIVASLLTKHCLIPWQQGEDWFWDTLVDADLASNSAGWQWVAGCGADAAPYFRIFNPVSQSEKFDAKGDYIRQWVPELQGFSDKEIHAPWLVSPERQKDAGCIVGKDYPEPVVDVKVGRTRALEAYEVIKL